MMRSNSPRPDCCRPSFHRVFHRWQAVEGEIFRRGSARQRMAVARRNVAEAAMDDQGSRGRGRSRSPAPAFTDLQLCIRSASFCAEGHTWPNSGQQAGEMPAASASPRGRRIAGDPAASGSANRLRRPPDALEFHFVSWHWVVLWRRAFPVATMPAESDMEKVGQAMQDQRGDASGLAAGVCRSVGGRTMRLFRVRGNAGQRPAA